MKHGEDTGRSGGPSPVYSLLYSHSTVEMSLPTGPPIPRTALLILWVAPVIAGPADDLTLDKPSAAFDCILVAVSFVFEVACEAASLAFSVVEAHRRGDLRVRNWRLLWRISVRDAIDTDIASLELSMAVAIGHRAQFTKEDGLKGQCWQSEELSVG